MKITYTTEEIDFVKDIVLWSEDKDTVSFSCVWYYSVESVSVFQFAADEPLPKDPSELGDPVAVISRGKYMTDQRKIVIPRPFPGRYQLLFVSYDFIGKKGEEVIGYFGDRLSECVCEYSRKFKISYSVNKTNSFGPKGEYYRLNLRSNCYMAEGMLYVYCKTEDKQYETGEILPNQNFSMKIPSSGNAAEQFELCLSGEETARKYYDIVRE